MCLTVFLHNLSPSPLAPSISYSIDFFNQSLSSFCNTWPYHHNLFCCSTEITSSNPNLSQLFIWNSIFCLNATHPSDHSHLCPLKCHLFSFCTGKISLPCNILLCTQLLYNLPLTVNDTSILVRNMTCKKLSGGKLAWLCIWVKMQDKIQQGHKMVLCV